MAVSEKLLQAIAVTAELTGTVLSESAARVMASDLARYPEAWVFAALVRCRRELRGRLTLAEILNRLDDGRPGVEEAWAMLPKNEDVSAVWTDEMRDAFAVASPLLGEGDTIAARMAFKEAYTAAVQKARDAATPPTWTATLGHDPHGREHVLLEAVARGRLTLPYAQNLLPHLDQPSGRVLALIGSAPKLIGRAA